MRGPGPACGPERAQLTHKTGSVEAVVHPAMLFFLLLALSVSANPDAKRLYDDLLSNYNRLIRPVSNNTHTVLVKLGLRLSQLIDLVSTIA